MLGDARTAAEMAYRLTKELADKICSRQEPLQAKITMRILEQYWKTELAALKFAELFQNPTDCLKMNVQPLRDTLEYLILVEHGLNTFYETVLKGATPDGN